MIRHELIGSEIRIISSLNPSLKNLKGKVIDETKNMMIIETDKGIKKIIKNQIKMELKINGKTMELDGKDLVRRPVESIRK